ncbi:MAG: KH domain-containing protein [Patescibacteria group bacterium]|nr:KH domain-containing protein [Patescibacteria group bacterium]
MSEKVAEIKARIKKLFSLWVDENKVNQLDIEAKLDERGVLVEINGPQEILSLIIGKRGQTVNAVRQILKSIGGALGAAISLKVQTKK